MPHHSYLVNIVALISVTQEREERVRSFVARIRGLARVSELSIKGDVTRRCPTRSRISSTPS